MRRRREGVVLLVGGLVGGGMVAYLAAQASLALGADRFEYTAAAVAGGTAFALLYGIMLAGFDVDL